MKRRVQAPDERWWTVQQVWWPRPTQTSIAADAAVSSAARRGGGGALFGLVFDAILVAVWPVILLFRLLLHRPWLVEAFPDGNLGVEGFAWRVRGLGASAACVEAIASGIHSGNRSPAPPGARPVAFRRKVRRELFRL